MIKIIVLGGKGMAITVAEQIIDNQLNTHDCEFLGFAFDDENYGKEINNIPVLCKTKEVYKKYSKYNDVKFIFCMYRRDKMKERTELIKSYNIPLEKWANFVHYRATVLKSVKMGNGNIILSNSVINSNVIIGNFNIIQSSVLIEHDARIGNNNLICGHSVIGSESKINNSCFIGLNSTINNRIIINDFSFIGMGSNVIKTVNEESVVYGNPAKFITKNVNFSNGLV